MFKRDSRKLLDIIKELNLGTDSKTWIKGLKYFRKATQELQDHYYVTSEGSQRKKVSRVDLNKIF